jgi:hypothetical protein
MAYDVPKGLLSVVTGNTPGARGAMVDALLRAAPRALVLAVSIQDRGEGYPAVQRFVSGADARFRDSVPRGATGDAVVILRQDLLSLRRTAGRVHLVLALPQDLDVLPFLVELWRARVGSGWGTTTTPPLSSSVSMRPRARRTSGAYTRPYACGTEAGGASL